MKVVKRGKKYREVTCDFCEAIIAFEDSEVQVEGLNSSPDSSSVWDYSAKRYIICPECNHKIEIQPEVHIR